MKVQYELKIDQEHFEAVKDGRKKFEIRKNDRDYHVGDLLVLREYNPNCRSYTDESIRVEISYMTDYAQKDGYVVLGIEEIWEGEELTEIKKVVIPHFVDKWIKENPEALKHNGKFNWWHLSSICGGELGNLDVKFGLWFNRSETLEENRKLFLRAMLDGYEVEKLYNVKIFDNGLETKYLKRLTSGGIGIAYMSYLGSGENDESCDFTEQEIKSIDERYWAFAVEVEG